MAILLLLGLVTMMLGLATAVLSFLPSPLQTEQAVALAFSSLWCVAVTIMGYPPSFLLG